MFLFANNVSWNYSSHDVIIKNLRAYKSYKFGLPKVYFLSKKSLHILGIHLVRYQQLSIHRYASMVSAYGFVSAQVLEFKWINQFICLNLVHERSQINKRSPKVNIFVLIIADVLSIFKLFVHFQVASCCCFSDTQYFCPFQAWYQMELRNRCAQ